MFKIPTLSTCGRAARDLGRAPALHMAEGLARRTQCVFRTRYVDPNTPTTTTSIPPHWVVEQRVGRRFFGLLARWEVVTGFATWDGRRMRELEQ